MNTHVDFTSPSYDPANYANPVPFTMADSLDDVPFDDDAAEYWQTYGYDEVAQDWAAAEYDAYMAQYDDDFSFYHGDYSEM